MRTTLEVTILEVTRKGHSRNGNPTKVLHTDVGSFTTKRDAQVGYKVSDNWSDLPALITLERGLVVDVEVAR